MSIVVGFGVLTGFKVVENVTLGVLGVLFFLGAGHVTLVSKGINHFTAGGTLGLEAHVWESSTRVDIDTTFLAFVFGFTDPIPVVIHVTLIAYEVSIAFLTQNFVKRLAGSLFRAVWAILFTFDVRVLVIVADFTGVAEKISSEHSGH